MNNTNVIVITIRNNKKLQYKIPVEITVGNSLYKINFKYMKSGNNTEQVMKYRGEICLNDLQRNIVNFNICLKIIALKAFSRFLKVLRKLF